MSVDFTSKPRSVSRRGFLTSSATVAAAMPLVGAEAAVAAQPEPTPAKPHDPVNLRPRVNR